MKRQTQLGVGLLLLSSCGKNLPPEAPDFRIENALNTRADATFCFAQDEDPFNAFTVTNPDAIPIDDPNNTVAFSSVDPKIEVLTQGDPCLRFTVFKENGEFALTDAESSSCAIRPNQKLKDGEPLAFILKTADEFSPIAAEQKLSMRIDVFEAGQGLVRSAFVAPFELQEDAPGENEADLLDQTITFFEDNKLSCVVPPAFIGGSQPVADLINQKENVTVLNQERAFHSATTIGTPNVPGEGVGILVAGGLNEVVGNANADSVLTNSIELFDRTQMRFITAQQTLTNPRAFHEAVALPKRDELLQVALVGGTTRSVGLDLRFFLQAVNNKSPFPVMPVPPQGAATGYDVETAAGVEIVSVSADGTTVVDRFEVNAAPGRFGPAVATIGDQIFYFGGVATTANQGCQSLTTTDGVIQNFFCNDYIEVTRAGTTAADFSAITVSGLNTSRIGAAAVPIGQDQVLLIGGNVGAGEENEFAEIVDITTGISTPVTTAGLTPEARRAFFALLPLPGGDGTQFAMFGGEKLKDAGLDGRLVSIGGGVDDFGAKNFAAVLDFDEIGRTLAIFEATGASLDQKMTRPSGNDLSPELLTPVSGDFVALREDETRDEDRDFDAADQNFINFCNNPDFNCDLTNLGERFVFPIALPGPNNTILFMGGARGPLFPQDAILSMDVTNPAAPILTQLNNPNDPTSSLHLFRRAVGLRGVNLPTGVGAKMLVLTGGIGGFGVPIFDVVNGNTVLVDIFSSIPAVSRRDVSFFTFETPVDIVSDACSFEREEVFTESDVCGFANTSIQGNLIQRLFGR